MNFLDTDLYDRQGKAISNFYKVLPSVQSDLAQEMTKYPYNFDFLTISVIFNHIYDPPRKSQLTYVGKIKRLRPEFVSEYKKREPKPSLFLIHHSGVHGTLIGRNLK